MDRIAATLERLWNWQRWVLNDSPHIGYPNNFAVFGTHTYENADREGWGETHKEKIPPPVNIRDARDVVDVAIMCVGIEHTMIIKRYYYNRIRRAAEYRKNPVADEDLAASVRALADHLYPVQIRSKVKVIA